MNFRRNNKGQDETGRPDFIEDHMNQGKPPQSLTSFCRNSIEDQRAELECGLHQADDDEHQADDGWRWGAGGWHRQGLGEKPEHAETDNEQDRHGDNECIEQRPLLHSPVLHHGVGTPVQTYEVNIVLIIIVLIKSKSIERRVVVYFAFKVLDLSLQLLSRLYLIYQMNH